MHSVFPPLPRIAEEHAGRIQAGEQSPIDQELAGCESQDEQLTRRIREAVPANDRAASASIRLAWQYRATIRAAKEASDPGRSSYESVYTRPARG